MERAAEFAGKVCFGVFEADLASRELRKRGRKAPLQDQPFQILALLLRRPGEIVTREELHHALWPANTYVEFEHGVNTAVKKLRQALGDSAENPRFIETLPRKGYRFIAPVSIPETKPPARHSYRTLALIVAAFLTTAAVVIWMVANIGRGRHPMPEARTSFNPVLLVGYTGTKSEPSFSADGDRVAFTWEGPKQDNIDIYVTQIGGGEPVRLTDDPAFEHAPAWSPDGRSIVFLRKLSRGRAGIFVIPAIGGTAAQIGELRPRKNLEAYARPTWHPGGGALIISDANSDSEPTALFLVSVQTGEKRRLTSPPPGTMGDFWPAVSPDGHVLLFVRAMPDVVHQDIYALEISNDLRPMGDPKRLTFTKPFNRQPAWSPDGTSIVYSSGESPHHPSLWRMNLPRPLGPGAVEQLPFDDANWPTISRQGRLVYGRKPWDFDIWRLELGGEKRRERLAMNSTRLEHTPQYSPDGEQIAFASDRSGTLEIWVCRADGSGAIRLTSFGGPYVSGPTWSPDGSRIAFSATMGEGDVIYLIGSKGGRPERLMEEPGSGPTWSRDGRWIYFGSKRTGRWEMWRVSVAEKNRPPVQVTKGGGEWGLESVDGRFLYYRLDGAVWRVPADGGAEMRLIPSCFPQVFEVVERGIYFVSASQRPAIQFFDFDTGETTAIADYSEAVSSPISNAMGWGLSASPDRRWLLFSKREDRGSDLMLVENFR